MSEERIKSVRLMAYWMVGTVLIVFAAITAYTYLWVRPFMGLGAGFGTVLRTGFPIWGATALAAIIIFAGYYFYTKRKG
jgi:hypothetical protein